MFPSDTFSLLLKIILSQEHNSHVCDTQKFSGYEKYWKKVPRIESLYLKDWHFHRDTKDYYSAYNTPSFFASDWLNEWWESREVHRFLCYEETIQLTLNLNRTSTTITDLSTLVQRTRGLLCMPMFLGLSGEVKEKICLDFSNSL